MRSSTAGFDFGWSRSPGCLATLRRRRTCHRFRSCCSTRSARTLSSNAEAVRAVRRWGRTTCRSTDRALARGLAARRDPARSAGDTSEGVLTTTLETRPCGRPGCCFSSQQQLSSPRLDASPPVTASPAAALSRRPGQEESRNPQNGGGHEETDCGIRPTNYREIAVQETSGTTEQDACDDQPRHEGPWPEEVSHFERDARGSASHAWSTVASRPKQ